MLNYLQRKLKYLKNPKLLVSGIYAIYKLKYWHRKTYRNILRIIQNVGGLISPFEATYLYEIAIQNRQIPGCILDFGSYKGLSTCVLSQAAARIKKNVISFESFKGLPSPTELDSGFKEGEYKACKEEFVNNVNRWGHSETIRLMEGDATKTLREGIRLKKITNYSLAFIDIDLYVTTKDILFLLDDISEGGEIICIHDIHSLGIQTAIKEFMNSCKNVVSIRYPSATCVAELTIKSKK